jgi:hypothetical protein
LRNSTFVKKYKGKKSVSFIENFSFEYKKANAVDSQLSVVIGGTTSTDNKRLQII